MTGCVTKIVVMDYYNPYPGLPIPPSNAPLADQYLPELNTIIREAAADYGVAVAEVEQAFRGNAAELIYVNRDIYTNPLLRIPFTPWFEQNVDFHPRPAGHQVIADAFWAAAGLVLPVPALATLPDLFTPNVALVAPWTCGECALAGRQQAALDPLPEPTNLSIEWLGAQLWNRITRPMICWLIALFQTGLNIYAGNLNTVWLPAINTFYRLLFTLLYWLTSAYQNGWFMGEALRDELWQLNDTSLAQLTALQRLAASQGVATGETLGVVLQAWVLVFTGVVQPLRYFLTLYVETVAPMMDIVTHLTDHKPAPLVAIADFWLFGALVGTLQGIWESQLGWWLGAEIALFYLGTGMFVLDEAAEV